MKTKMKYLAKVLALAVLAIFILSIPAALAENTGATKAEGIVKESKTEDSKKDLVKDLKEAKAETKSLVEKAKEVKENILEKQKLLKERHENAKKAYDQQKEKVAKIREESKSCKDDTEKCKSKKTELKVGVRQHLVKTIELIQKSMDRFTEKVQESAVLTEEEKASTLAMIKENNDKLNAEIEKLNALAENATNEELKAAIKEVKQLWQDTNKIERYVLAQLTNNKLENLVKKHTEYYNAMVMRIKTLSDAGQNVDELKAIAEKFKAASDKLKEDEQLAEEKWKEAKAEGTKKALVLAQEAQKKVRADLKETKQILRDFLVHFKEQYQEVKAEAKKDKETKTGAEQAEEPETEPETPAETEAETPAATLEE